MAKKPTTTSAAVLMRDNVGVITWADVVECPSCHALVRNEVSKMTAHQKTHK